jgi:hypothetical protein
VLGWPDQPVTLRSDDGGLLLLLPGLVALDLPGAVSAAKFPRVGPHPPRPCLASRIKRVTAEADDQVIAAQCG